MPVAGNRNAYIVFYARAGVQVASIDELLAAMESTPAPTQPRANAMAAVSAASLKSSPAAAVAAAIAAASVGNKRKQLASDDDAVVQLGPAPYASMLSLIGKSIRLTAAVLRV